MLTVVRISLLSFLLFIGGVHSAHAILATDCTLYAAANGKDGNNGLTPSTPKTLEGASAATVPGSVVCLLGGSYNRSSEFVPRNNGTANAWIVYKAYGDSEAKFVWTGVGGEAIFHVHFFPEHALADGKQYLEFRGLTLDGGNQVKTAFLIQYSHHLRVIGNKMQNFGAAGIATKFADYITSDSNTVFHSGYNQGWSSGISYNSHQWFDNAPGFHSFVVNNIISGTYDGSTNHSDGNGIIMDLSNGTYNEGQQNTPPVLITNNVVYENGGRGIVLYFVSNIWAVNNTVYKNTLDKQLPPNHPGADIASDRSKNCLFINNIAYSWNNQYPYFKVGASSTGLIYDKDLYYGGSNNFTYSDPTQLIHADPQFVAPPPLDPTQDGQYRTALPPWQLGNALMLQANSPAIDAGIDPTKLSGVAPEIIAGLKQYVLQDVTGAARPQGNGFDLGAYEYTPPSAALPAAPNQLTIVAQ